MKDAGFAGPFRFSRSLLALAPSLFVFNVRRYRCTRTQYRLRTRNRSSPLRCFPPWCPAGTPASPEGAHIASPQSRAPPPPTNPPPSSLLPRASLPCDCPILRPRAGLLLSRACDSPFAMSFGATHATARESPHPYGTLLPAACLRRDTSCALQACSRVWTHISMLPNLACSLILTL